MLKSNEDELGQHSAERVEGKRLIVEWISKQPHLPQDIDDILLDRFLSTCKYNIEKCKKRIDKFYTIKTLYPQYFGSGDPTSQDIRDISKVCFRAPLTKYTPEGYQVTMFGLLDNDATKFDMICSMRRDYLVLLSYFLEEKNVDFVLIYDTRNATLSHIPLAMPHLNDLVQLAQDVMPVRIKQMHFIISSTLVNKAVNTLISLMKEKIKKRVHVHSGNLDTLYKFVPQDILPVEYGGKEESVKKLNETWQNKIESFKDWLLREVPKSSDESKRPVALRRNDLFGVDGNFKSLTVD